MLNEVIHNHRVNAVKLVDQFPMYELGLALGRLRDVCSNESIDVGSAWYACHVAKTQLRAVLNGDQPINFCRRAANELEAAISDQQQELRSLNSDDDTKRPTPWMMYGLKQKIEVFEHQLRGELGKTASYVVPDLGIFSAELLAENADRHIPESIRPALSPFAIEEYKQAGRCLAFGLYSASGFHAARAVENVLRVYYQKFIGPPPDKAMGLLASHLEDLFQAKDKRPLLPKENTVRHLRDITNFDRNPLIHRGVQLKEIDATTIFNSALGVIVEMAKELGELDAQVPMPFDEEDIFGHFKHMPEPQVDEPIKAKPKRKSQKATSALLKSGS